MVEVESNPVADNVVVSVLALSSRFDGRSRFNAFMNSSVGFSTRSVESF